MTPENSYNRMKDSGISWIGKIPETWQVLRLKSLVILRQGGDWGKDVQGNDGDVVCLRIADFDFDKGCFQKKPIESYTWRNYLPLKVFKIGLHPGDIIVEKSGGGEKTPVGRAVIFDMNIPAMFANFSDKLIFDKKYVLPYYIAYCWKAMYLNQVTMGYVKQTTGIQNLDISMLLSKEKIPVPCLCEQQRIIYYLDSRCSQIDSMIASAKANIEDYKALKQSVITQAVTKGLNPNVEMKDSGVEWVKTIPEKWTVRRLFQASTQVKRKNTKLQEQNLLSLSYGKIKRKDINTLGGLLPESFDGYNIIEKGDVVLRLTDLQNDHTSLRVGLAIEKGIITSAYITVRPNLDVEPEYLYFLLHSFDVMKGFYGMGSGVRQSLTFDEVKQLKIPIPCLDEQIQIVCSLNKKISDVENLISEQQALIDDLEAAKKSLIYECVTGKRRVPDIKE